MVVRGDIQDRGVVPPEIAMAGKIKKFTAELAHKGIRIQEISKLKCFL
jgi:hypothetical protein